MPRCNRIDPWGDLHVNPARGIFTGNRGCVVDDDENVVRHHGSSLWITCELVFRDWKSPLARGRRWTPLFFLDEAVALAAGHRPCAFCRRKDYNNYRMAVSEGLRRDKPLLAAEINSRLIAERHTTGRGLTRAHHRITWESPIHELPNGAVVTKKNQDSYLVLERHLLKFHFDGWGEPIAAPNNLSVSVLTPPTSVLALKNGFNARLHDSAAL